MAECHSEDMRLLALITTTALVLAGCSAPAATPSAAPASLKESCDKLTPLSADYGQAAPDRQRFGTYLPKFQAVSDAGDQATKDAMAPLLAALSNGATGDGSALKQMTGAMLTLVVKCKAAGSTFGS